MNKRLLLAFVLVAALATGCLRQVPPSTPTAQAGASATLELVGQETRTLTWDDIQALPVLEGWGGIKNSVGSITPPARYRGVTLQDLCALAGGITPQNSVSVIAKDGYAMTFSYDQVVNGAFIAYDVATGDEIAPEGPLHVIIAYEREGGPLDPESEGALRLAIVGPRNQVTDGHWWIKWVERIEVKALAQEWSLHLEGPLPMDVDPATFESGAAPNCHGVSWSDEDGQTWSGIALWRLLGFVDDEMKHGDDAFNDELADAGYDVTITASDGYSISLTSAAVARNDDIIVAYQLNGTPLPEDDWPLRLVGPELGGPEQISRIVSIEIILP
jgi:DMSO/TMAO reductase YedYZ molybdopterin-dependent catalytic subunit